MRMISLFSALSGAVASVLLSSACASAPAACPNELFVVEPNREIVQSTACDYSKNSSSFEMQPGKVYICPKFAEVFVVDRLDSQVNEEGLLSARVYGKTIPYSFWQWMINGEAPYRLAFRIVWFDRNGKIVNPATPSPMRIRECLPGDPVRFSGLAPSEDCKSFSFVVGILHEQQEKEILAEQQAQPAAQPAPAKPDTKANLKKVKAI